MNVAETLHPSPLDSETCIPIAQRIVSGSSRTVFNLSKNRRSQNFQLLYIRRGSGVQRVDFHDYPFSEGDLILIQPRQYFRIDHISDYEALYFKIPNRLIREHIGLAEIVRLFYIFENRNCAPILSLPGSRAVDMGFESLYRECSQKRDSNTEAIVWHTFHVVAIHLEREGSKKRAKSPLLNEFDILLRLKEVVENGQPKTRKVSDVARLSGVSQKHLRKITKRC